METIIDRHTGKAIIRSLRLGHEAEANQHLTTFIDNLSRSLTEEKLQQNPQLTTIFAEMLDAQQKRDLLRLADIIQYQLLDEK